MWIIIIIMIHIILDIRTKKNHKMDRTCLQAQRQPAAKRNTLSQLKQKSGNRRGPKLRCKGSLKGPRHTHQQMTDNDPRTCTPIEDMSTPIEDICTPIEDMTTPIAATY